MSKPIITVENLGKAYFLGQKYEKNATLRDAIAQLCKAPVERFRRRFSEAGTADDAFWPIRHINFHVNQGEVMVLVGRNGAGKSTLLKTLSRITEPTEGKANLRGRVASLLEVGTGFHPELTGRENIYLNGAILGMKKTEIDRKFDAIVDFAEVEKFLDTAVKRYSSGMYVRLAFAVAAHLEPEILIVDEVLAVGDASFQRKCLGKMGDVVKQGRTVLFVSHNMDAVMQLCTHVLLIKNGRASERLAPDEGVKQYLALVNDGSSLPLAQKPRIQDSPRDPIFVGLDINTDSGHDNVVETCGRVSFDIEMNNFSDIEEARVGVAICNSRGNRVAFFHSQYHSGLVIPGTRTAHVRCTIPSLPLIPGSYGVELVVSTEDKVIEKVERADVLEVVFKDVFGTGKIPNSSQGTLVLPCDWEHFGESSPAAVSQREKVVA